MITATEAHKATIEASANGEQQWLDKALEQAEKLVLAAIKSGSYTAHYDIALTGPEDNRDKLMVNELVKHGYTATPSPIHRNQQPLLTRITIAWSAPVTT